ncbi:DUF305 domain-containing protein [Aquibium carbonis]|jgi:uncharacterized protein (DUF305 family)|uniref:DUF305 domain-containing protein n=1 Tax=Aquibium carbonis TaxID=2495581 RepID=A0A429YVK1_9HYPH|nr:DUF305 domain-containing protein [Aquibium carbonis]RST85459.1 DUF305 domain-containing protein [Aquibium carbonis]
MKSWSRIVLLLALAASPGVAMSQDAHHPGSGSDHAAPAAPAVPEQCAPMMQMMEGMMGQHMDSCMNALPESSRAYMGAMMGMHGPMMEAMQIDQPDVAFVKGMIPHHQAAIDMAKAALQFGSDEQVRKWAQEIIDAQQAEIDAMNAWLQARGQ